MAGESRFVRFDLDVRIYIAQPITCRFDLSPAEVFGTVDDLALQVRFFDHVEIDNANPSHPRRCEIHSHRRTETTRSDHQHAGGFQTTLPLHADLRHYQVTAVTQDLLVGKLRQRLSHFRLNHRAACD